LQARQIVGHARRSPTFSIIWTTPSRAPGQTTPNVPPRLVTPANKLPPKPTLPAVLREGLRAIFREPPAQGMPAEFLTLLQRLDAKPPSRTAD
jgi:hypothetical protein